MAEQLAALTGDPDGIAGAAANYKTMSEIILQASTELADISRNDKFSSDAVIEIRSRATSTSARAKDVHDRYLGAANALTTYATKLNLAQQKARNASSRYAANEDEVQRLTLQSNYLHDQILHGGPESLALTKQKAAVDARIQEHQIQSATEKANYLAAGVDKERAALEAVGALQLAADAHSLNDTRLEVIQFNLGNFSKSVFDGLNAVLETLASIMTKVASILSIAGVICLLIPGLEPLGGLLLALGKVATAVSFISTLLSFVFGGSTLGELVSATLSAAAAMLITGFADKATKTIGTAVGTDATKSLLGFISEGLGQAGGDTFDHFVSDPSQTFGPNSKLTLFPTSSGQPWNVPPTVPLDFGPPSGESDAPTLIATGPLQASPAILAYAAS